MSDLTARVEAIIREHCVLAYPPVDGEDRMVRKIAVLIAEEKARAFDEGQRTADGSLRMCVNCGKTVDAAIYKRGDELPGCADDGMAACTFDMTPSEACRHWSERWHELAASQAVLIVEAREAGRREGLEAAAKGCDWVAATHRQTEKDAMDYGAGNSAFAAGEIAELFEERAAAIRALAEKEPRDDR